MQKAREKVMMLAESKRERCHVCPVDRASAAVLSTPAMCHMLVVLWEQIKCRDHMRYIRRWSLADPDERAHTTTLFFEKTWIVDELHKGPHTATAITTGTIPLPWWLLAGWHG